VNPPWDDWTSVGVAFQREIFSHRRPPLGVGVSLYSTGAISIEISFPPYSPPFRSIGVYCIRDQVMQWKFSRGGPPPSLQRNIGRVQHTKKDRPFFGLVVFIWFFQSLWDFFHLYLFLCLCTSHRYAVPLDWHWNVVGETEVCEPSQTCHFIAAGFWQDHFSRSCKFPTWPYASWRNLWFHSINYAINGICQARFPPRILSDGEEFKMMNEESSQKCRSRSSGRKMVGGGGTRERSVDEPLAAGGPSQRK
jgi:hypothetical protein